MPEVEVGERFERLKLALAQWNFLRPKAKLGRLLLLAVADLLGRAVERVDDVVEFVGGESGEPEKLFVEVGKLGELDLEKRLVKARLGAILFTEKAQ